jgi:diguanylate cyclase (GGDEF)-like protein
VQRSRRRNSRLAVVFVDLDGFKQINDFLGHDSGDALLIELAGRLRTHLRASDLVARLGGDEFLVVLEEVPESAAIAAIARKLLGEAEKPYLIAGATARVTASIGISVFPDDAADAAALMKHADMAMYAAKQKGKNTYCFYSAVPANDPAEGSVEKKA